MICDIIWQQSPKTMHKSGRNTKTGQFWLCFLKYPQFCKKNGRIWYQMCLCGSIAPPGLATFMSSDQNVAPEVSLWLQAGLHVLHVLHVLQLLWGLWIRYLRIVNCRLCAGWERTDCLLVYSGNGSRVFDTLHMGQKLQDGKKVLEMSVTTRGVNSDGKWKSKVGSAKSKVDSDQKAVIRFIRIRIWFGWFG